MYFVFLYDYYTNIFATNHVVILNMYPMNFSEFLDATGNKELDRLISSREWKVIDLMKDKLENLLRQYHFVGGMPNVVLKYVEKGDVHEVKREQEAIRIG